VRKRCDTWPSETDLHQSHPYPGRNRHNLHDLHAQARSYTVKVFVKVLVKLKNLHEVLKLTVKVVTVVKVFGRIQKKNL